jgi:hypothetical protein
VRPGNSSTSFRNRTLASIGPSDGHPAVLAPPLKREARPHWSKRTALHEEEVAAPRAPRPVDAIPRERVYPHGQRRRKDIGPPAGFLECPDENQDGRHGEDKAQPVNPAPQDDPPERLDLHVSGLHCTSPPHASAAEDQTAPNGTSASKEAQKIRLGLVFVIVLAALLLGEALSWQSPSGPC